MIDPNHFVNAVIAQMPIPAPVTDPYRGWSAWDTGEYEDFSGQVFIWEKEAALRGTQPHLYKDTWFLTTHSEFMNWVATMHKEIWSWHSLTS